MTKVSKYCLALLFLFGLISCKDDELVFPDNVAQFESDQLGFSVDEDALTINVNFSRSVEVAGSIEIAATLSNLEYGIQFTTEPALSGGKIIIPVAVGTTSVSFRILKAAGVALIGDEQIKFVIATTIDQLVPGEKKELTLSFSEIIAVRGSVGPVVGGALQPNKVFIDLSGNRQFITNRGAWDLGFYSVSGAFRVVLNTSSGMLARALEKNDLNAVTAADTIGLGKQLSLKAIFAAVMGPPPSWIPDAINWADDPGGDLTKTAIAEISATDSENKVYIINRGNNPDGDARGWKKVRIIRKGSGYTLQYADIGATDFRSLHITKDEAYLFNYVNFDSGPVIIEPKKEQWDIAFTVFTNATPTGPPGSPVIPFEFRDFVTQNRYKVEAVQVMTANVTFENFVAAGISGITFSTSQNAIGSSWRTLPSNSNTPPSINSDRFYIVKDTAGNIYKLRFTALTKAGERGHPAFEFELISEAG